MDAMTLKEAMDRLGLSAPEVAEALELQPQTVRQMRLDPGHANYRSPPEGWQRALAKLARSRGRGMARIADQLEREG
jgi:hypothetical protein